MVLSITKERSRQQFGRLEPLVIRSCGGARSGESKVLVDKEFPDTRVASGENGEADDDSCYQLAPRTASLKALDGITKGPQLRGDLLQLSQSLGNGVTLESISIVWLDLGGASRNGAARGGVVATASITYRPDPQPVRNIC